MFPTIYDLTVFHCMTFEKLWWNNSSKDIMWFNAQSQSNFLPIYININWDIYLLHKYLQCTTKRHLSSIALLGMYWFSALHVKYLPSSSTDGVYVSTLKDWLSGGSENYREQIHIIISCWRVICCRIQYKMKCR